MSTKMIVIYAAPDARTVCPPDLIEGRWMEIPEETREIAVETFGGRPLIVRPTGRMERRSFDGATAPVWELGWKDAPVSD